MLILANYSLADENRSTHDYFGAFIHGFVPTDVISQIAGPSNPFAIPVAAAIEVTIYIRS